MCHMRIHTVMGTEDTFPDMIRSAIDLEIRSHQKTEACTMIPHGISHPRKQIETPDPMETQYAPQTLPKTSFYAKATDLTHILQVARHPLPELSVTSVFGLVVPRPPGPPLATVLSTTPISSQPTSPALKLAISSTPSAFVLFPPTALALIPPTSISPFLSLSSLRLATTNSVLNDPMHATAIAIFASAALQTRTQGESICFVTPTVDSAARTIAMEIVTRTREKTAVRARDCLRGMRLRCKILSGMVITISPD